MPLQLQKGGRANLENEAGGSLTKVLVGLGWDAKPTQQSGADFDLDASAIIVGEDGLAYQHADSSFVYYYNDTALDGAVTHSGDNQTGAGDGDDEVITIDLSRVPKDVQKFVFPVSINDADTLGQNFGMVSNAKIRVVDAATGVELASYQLDDKSFMDTAIIFGELVRGSSGWELRALPSGYAAGLTGIVTQYGFVVEG